jgi:hypothetical protein
MCFSLSHFVENVAELPSSFGVGGKNERADMWRRPHAARALVLNFLTGPKRPAFYDFRIFRRSAKDLPPAADNPKDMDSISHETSGTEDPVLARSLGGTALNSQLMAFFGSNPQNRNRSNRAGHSTWQNKFLGLDVLGLIR